MMGDGLPKRLVRRSLSGLLKMYCLFLLCLLFWIQLYAEGASWSTLFSASDNDKGAGEGNGKSKETMVSPVLNREIQTSVIAHDWSSSPQNIFCEAYAYFLPPTSDGKTDSDDDEDSPNANNQLDLFTNNINAANQYVESLVKILEDDKPSISTYRDAIKVALKASTISSQERNLLEYSLVLRANSPLCEVHRSLAREAVFQSVMSANVKDQIAFMLYDNRNENMVAVIYPEGVVLYGYDETFKANLQRKLGATNLASYNMTSDAKQDLLLPGETLMGNFNNETEPRFVIFYSDMGTLSFAKMYRYLQSLDNVQFIVRHLGNVKHEEEKNIFNSRSPNSTEVTWSLPLVLQGYGVRLDIRNVEYKVFDDRSDGGVNTTDKGLVNLTSENLKLSESPKSNDVSESLLTPLHQYLAGVNLSIPLSSLNGHNDQSTGWIFDLESSLWNIHDEHQVHSQIIPPVWQRRRLPIQATAAIVSSKDPLFTLQEISQNLPSVASTLVHLRVPKAIHEMNAKIEEFMEQDASSFQPDILYFNGRPFRVDRPSFNLFELLNMIKQEQEYLNVLKLKIGPYLRTSDGKESKEALRAVQKAWMMGTTFVDTMVSVKGVARVDDDDDDDDSMAPKSDSPKYRIDVGRGWKNAVIYLNDVEKDPQYRQWPRSLRQALMNMQFGMPPSVRRNLYTILAITDPLTESNNAGMSLASQLMQSQFPARLGILILNDNDLSICSKWIREQEIKVDTVPCPVPPILTNMNATLEDLKEIPASTQAIHRLVSGMLQNLVTRPGAISAYVEYLFASIANDINGGLSMFDLLEMHGEMVASMSMGSKKGTMKDFLNAFKEAEVVVDDYSTYGMTLRFAVSKGLRSGMSFVNGRPLPFGNENPQEISRIFGEEQNHIFGLIMQGDITDSLPKSVYAKMLTGSHVFKKHHPLLVQGETFANKHILMETKNDSKEFIVSRSVPFLAEASFVVDAYLSFDTAQGLELASKFITILDSFSPSIQESTTESIDPTAIGLTYRILPNTVGAAASAICPLLAQGSLLDVDNMQAILTEYSKLRLSDLVTDDAELLEFASRVLPRELRERIFSSEKPMACQSSNVQKAGSPDKIVANGRVFSLDDSVLEKEDIELLLSMELKRAKAVTMLLKGVIGFTQPSDIEAISRVASFLAISEVSSSSNRILVEDIFAQIDALSDTNENPLHFSWNVENMDSSEDLPLEVALLLNPVTETAQRVSPILQVIRDQLKLPLRLVLAPPSEIDADSKIPITSYYRLVADPRAIPDDSTPKAVFSYLPTNHLLTIRVDVPEPWNIQQTYSIQDTDNLLCDIRKGCSDSVYEGKAANDHAPVYKQNHVTKVEYGLKNLLFFGQCYEPKGTPPNGLQLKLVRKTNLQLKQSKGKDSAVMIGADGTTYAQGTHYSGVDPNVHYSDTLVMKNVGYWQLRANPGVWTLSIAEDSKGFEIFEMVAGSVKGGTVVESKAASATAVKTLFLKDFVSSGEVLVVKRRPGFETASLFHSEKILEANKTSDEVINVFSLATGHLYERFLKIMMLSVTKRTSSKVKFWFFENFLSPSFKGSVQAMSEQIGCEVEYVTYKWPEWLRGQTEKQRIIWGYKILFLDVLFPLDVKKIIYVDADQVIRGDLKELWDMDLKGAPYGYTPFCTSRESTLGYQFWRDGFWKNHLQGKPYHISALYVVDLERFRRTLVGDQLRSTYQQLSADPNSLSNLDQDLPNYAQHQVPIFSLPQEWLWCESWCSDETKSLAKTIDLCNNPEHKEPKVLMAKRIINGNLFNESWVELDAEVEGYEEEYLRTLKKST